MFWTRNIPGTENATLSRQADFVNRFFGSKPARAANRSVPACNMWADESGVVLTSEIPGFALEDIEITISGQDVAIKGNRKEQLAEGVKYIRQERNQGEFERAFQLPYRIDAVKVEAKLVNGILEVSLPRAETDKPRKIDIIAG